MYCGRETLDHTSIEGPLLQPNTWRANYRRNICTPLTANPSQRIIQPHHLHRPLITPVQITQPVHLPGVAEAALCHLAAGGGVVYKDIGPGGLVPLFQSEGISLPQ